MSTSKDTNGSKKKNRKRRLRLFNLVMLFMAAYFVFTIAKQEITIRDIQTQIEKTNGQYQELVHQEGILNKKIADATSDRMVENKAKSILGWVGKNEIKVVEKK